jgi:hypothetical protein
MDVATTLRFLDKWFANHRTTCGVERVDVSVEPEEQASVMVIVLSCPKGRNTIHGLIGDHELPQVIKLFAEKKRD